MTHQHVRLSAECSMTSVLSGDELCFPGDGLKGLKVNATMVTREGIGSGWKPKSCVYSSVAELHVGRRLPFAEDFQRRHDEDRAIIPGRQS